MQPFCWNFVSQIQLIFACIRPNDSILILRVNTLAEYVTSAK